MTHDEGRERRVVRGGRAIRKGNGLEWIIAKALHHLARESRDEDALVMSPQRQADGVEPEIRPAAFVRYRKAITADPDLAPIHNRKTDAARPHDDDAAVARSMGADAGNRCVMGVNDGTK